MRTKKSLKTLLSGVILTGIIAVLGLIKTKIMLKYLGDDSVGLYQLFSQIYTYLSLIDGGLAAGITYFLYKPVSENNYTRINAILSATKKYFNKIAMLILGFGVIFSFFIMFFIKETSFSQIYVQLCFILYVIASINSYFVAARFTLYEANQELYVSSSINYVLTITKSILEIMLSMLGLDLIWLIVSFLVLTLLRNFFIVFLSRKRFPELNVNSSEKDYTFKGEVKNLLVQKIGNVVFENIDVILISKFLGSVSVVMYMAYFQLENMIRLMVKRISAATLPSVGNLLITEKKKANKIFNELNSMLFYIANIICIPLVIVISYFVNLWYGSKYVVSDFSCICFILVLYINIIVMVLEVFIKADGKFALMKHAIIYQSAVNLILSILLIKPFGISGVLFATIFSFVTGNFIFYPKIIYREILQEKVSNYYKEVFKFVLCTIICYLLMLVLSKELSFNNLLSWLISSIILFGCNFFIVTLYFIFINRLTFVERLFYMISKKIKISLEKMKKILKLVGIIVLLFVISFIGVRFYEIKTEENVPTVIVLAYHHFTTAEDKALYYSDNKYVLAIEEFEKQLQYLQEEGYTPITTEQLYKWLNNEIELKEKSVLITIDDGNISTYYLALPLIEKYNFHAISFVITSRTRKKTPEWDAEKFYFLGQDLIKDIRTSHSSLELGSHSYNLHGQVNGKSPKDLSLEELSADVGKSKEILDTDVYCYPFGGYSSNYIQALKDNGYKMSFIYGPSSKTKRTDNVYTISRLIVEGTMDLEDFKKLLD